MFVSVYTASLYILTHSYASASRVKDATYTASNVTSWLTNDILSVTLSNFKTTTLSSPRAIARANSTCCFMCMKDDNYCIAFKVQKGICYFYQVLPLSSAQPVPSEDLLFAMPEGRCKITPFNHSYYMTCSSLLSKGQKSNITF